MSDLGMIMDVMARRSGDPARPGSILGGVDHVTATLRMVARRNGSYMVSLLPAELRAAEPTPEAPEIWIHDGRDLDGGIIALPAVAELLDGDRVFDLACEPAGLLMREISKALGPVHTDAQVAPPLDLDRAQARQWARVAGRAPWLPLLDMRGFSRAGLRASGRDV